MLEAAELLRELNDSGRRRLTPEPPLSFESQRWRPYVVESDGRISRRYWELCVLSGLRGALRSGDVWVAGSRRHADPETYRIPRSSWPARRAEVSKLIDQPLDPEQRLTACKAELEQHLTELDRALAGGGAVRIEDGERRRRSGRSAGAGPPTSWSAGSCSRTRG